MDKKKLVAMLLEQLERDRQALLEATKATLEAATHEESQPENEYDTRGLEASYLAGAQSKRVAELEESISICKNLQVRSFSGDEPVGPTALVQLDLEGKEIWVFLMPRVGGVTLFENGRRIQVVSGQSPLGQALLGVKVGGFAIVETREKAHEYEICSVQ